MKDDYKKDNKKVKNVTNKTIKTATKKGVKNV